MAENLTAPVEAVRQNFLSDAQRARLEALRGAHTLITSRGLTSNTAASASDVLMVARFILEGDAPKAGATDV